MLLVGGLLAAWVGVWGAWLAHPSAGLTQSALDVAHVARQRLPDVLYGRGGAWPDLLLASVALANVALSIAAEGLERPAIRWALRGLALLLILRLLPPYPFILDLWRSPDYGTRFAIAALAVVGWLVSLTTARWPDRVRSLALLGLTLAGLATGLWSALALERSFADATRLPFAPGWGLILYAAGLLVAALLSLGPLLRRPGSPSD
jgi:hypothetical protein